LSYEPAPWIDGETELEVILTDQFGRTATRKFPFKIAPLPSPALQVSEELVLNRQTGLYEQSVTITNSGPREIAGFDLEINGLTGGVKANNAVQAPGDSWLIEHRHPLAAGASTVLVIEYYNPVRGTPINPQLSVQLVSQPEEDPRIEAGDIKVNRCISLDDGILIEFDSEAGQQYLMQYSDDGNTWKSSPIMIQAAGNRTQWIDRGPPRTDTKPADAKTRFYRVRLAPSTD
jgi:hypothetical protein